MSEPEVTIGAWTLPLRKWCTHFRRKPRPCLARIEAGTYSPAEVVFGVSRKRRPPTSKVVIRVGEYELPIHRWAKLTGQRATEIAKRLESGIEPADAIFHEPPPGVRP